MELNEEIILEDVVKSKRDHVLIDETDKDKYALVEKKLPFKNHLHTFTIATLIGYYYADSSKKIKKGYNGFVHLSVYRDSPYLDFLKTFAIVHENDPLVLVDEKRLFSICEGYARTGIDLIIDWLDSKDDALENIFAKLLIEKFDELDVE